MDAGGGLTMPKPNAERMASNSRSVVVVGAGVIGSHLLPHLARETSIGRITIVDPDTYSEANLASQAVDACDVGHPKAQVQARRLRAFAGARLEVVGLVVAVADVPLGVLRADLCIGCLDSRSARRDLNRICWRLNMPWVDAGVHAAGSLARVGLYRPGPASTCYECAWSDHDYELMEQQYSCDGNRLANAPTRAPSALGALAAALQAIECRKLLVGGLNAPETFGRQIILDASANRHYVTKLSPNPHCRFDHDVWRVLAAADVRTVRDLIAAGRAVLRSTGEISLKVEEQSWVSRLVCRQCAREAPVLCLRGRVASQGDPCTSCGGPMLALAMHMQPRVSASQLAAFGIDQSIAALGLRSGDVVRVADRSREAYLEIGRSAAHCDRSGSENISTRARTACHVRTKPVRRAL
jgi:adenylyltransferase/sulfurtransferase